MSQFRNLVFEGGGVKGIAYSGALEVLEQEGVLGDVKRVAGTSAGAISAALVSLGAGGEDVARIVGGTQFRKFMDDSWGIGRDSQRLLGEFGWFKGEAFGDWMKDQIEGLCDESDITFAKLAQRARAPGSRFRELYVVGSNLTKQRPMVYSAETTPDVKVWKAVRISMSIPLFFACVKVDGEKGGRNVLVDGGVTWNYPLDLFDERKYLFDPAAGERPNYTRYDDDHVYNKETLGLRVDTRDEIAAEKRSWELPPAKIEDFFDYAKALVGFMGDMANKMHLHSNDWHRTIALDACGIRTTQFDLKDAEVGKLVESGRAGTRAYFEWFNNPAAEVAALNKV